MNNDKDITKEHAWDVVLRERQKHKEEIEDMRCSLRMGESRIDDLAKVLAVLIEKNGPIEITFEQLLALPGKRRQIFWFSDNVAKTLRIEVD